MQLSTKKIANLLYDNCSTFLINTIDSAGFPYTEIIDKPIYRDETMNFYLFTKANSLTLENLSTSSNSNFSFFSTNLYKKVVLKGHLKTIPDNLISLASGETICIPNEHQVLYFSGVEGILYSDYQTHLFYNLD